MGATTARAVSQVTSEPKRSTTPPRARITTASRVPSTSSPVSVSRATTTKPTTGAPVPTPQNSSILRRTPSPRTRTRSSPDSARAAIGRSENSASRKAIALTTTEVMPTERAVLTARPGCSTSASAVKVNVAPNHNPAWRRVRNQGTPSVVIRSFSVGWPPRKTQRWARSAPAVPQVAPTITATPT